LSRLDKSVVDFAVVNCGGNATPVSHAWSHQRPVVPVPAPDKPQGARWRASTGCRERSGEGQLTKNMFWYVKCILVRFPVYVFVHFDTFGCVLVRFGTLGCHVRLFGMKRTTTLVATPKGRAATTLERGLRDATAGSTSDRMRRGFLASLSSPISGNTEVTRELD
jgi:hypothetical protein